MAEKIIMPKQGLQMTAGTITEWLKREGDAVKEGEPLFAMETDKLTITIDSTVTGTLLKIMGEPGVAIPVAETVAIVGEPGEDLSPPAGGNAPASRKDTAESRTNRSGRVFISPRARKAATERQVDIASLTGTGPDGMIIERDVPFTSVTPKISPLAKKLAEREGVELSDVTGSGPRGKVMAADVRSAAAPGATVRATRGEHKVPLSAMRRVVAARMHESLITMAQANHRMSVDMSAAGRLREEFLSNQIKISYNDIILRCVAKALADCPYMNVSFEEDGLVCKDYVNLGMAVALDDGLIVPVIKDADLMCLPELSTAGRDLANRARENRLTAGDCEGGTFTVTNLGMYDVDDFTPIINPPQAAILGVGHIEKRVVVLADDTTAIRPMLRLSLSYDHRAVDGAPAAKFLQRVKKLLENPGLLI